MRRRITCIAVAVALAASQSVSAAESLAGFYYITPGGIGSGYADYFALFEDGSWEYGNQYVCSDDGALYEERVPHRAGQWRADANGLVLTETERTVVTGGTCICDAIACDLEGGTEWMLRPGLEIAIDPEAECASELDPMEELGVALPCLTIEGVGYFRLGPAEEMLP